MHYILADDKHFLVKKISPEDKFFKYSQRMYQKDPKFKIDYKKQLQILN
jgi:hypothetical protein